MPTAGPPTVITARGCAMEIIGIAATRTVMVSRLVLLPPISTLLVSTALPVKVMLQLAPGASAAPQVLPTTDMELPAGTTAVTFRATISDTFVTVTEPVPLTEKAMLVGETEIRDSETKMVTKVEVVLLPWKIT
ncbi:hypothetical protein EAW55_10615 [Legionella jordanis]|nr:hypothetical protein EAW55_10615 [Legionella jordanis]RMX21538.1 hypothetical protein EAS68_01895 [Legionella jordanis]